MSFLLYDEFFINWISLFPCLGLKLIISCDKTASCSLLFPFHFWAFSIVGIIILVCGWGEFSLNVLKRWIIWVLSRRFGLLTLYSRQVNRTQDSSINVGLFFIQKLADYVGLPCRIARGCKYCVSDHRSSCLVKIEDERKLPRYGNLLFCGIIFLVFAKVRKRQI